MSSATGDQTSPLSRMLFTDRPDSSIIRRAPGTCPLCRLRIVWLLFDDGMTVRGSHPCARLLATSADRENGPPWESLPPWIDWKYEKSVPLTKKEKRKASKKQRRLQKRSKEHRMKQATLFPVEKPQAPKGPPIHIMCTKT